MMKKLSLVAGIVALSMTAVASDAFDFGFSPEASAGPRNGRIRTGFR